MALSGRETPSGRVEIQVRHPDAGVTVLVEGENKKVYYNRSIRQHESGLLPPPAPAHALGGEAALLLYIRPPAASKLVDLKNERTRLTPIDLKINKWVFFQEQAEALRVLSDSYNGLFLEVPRAYENIYGIVSQEAGSQLYYAFDSF
ncbi:unnamed protein product [Arctogadus glacialis]